MATDTEITTAQLLLQIPADLKDRVQETAETEGVSVSAWAERLFEANVLPEEMTIDEEHKEARRLLPLLFEANRKHRFMTYVDAVEALGWDLRGSTRMMGKVAHLLDAAAVLANVPLIALHTVRANGGSEVNPEAFLNDPEFRAQLLAEAAAHTFTQTDVANIEAQLDNLFRKGKGNRAAWQQIKKTNPRFKDVKV
jgi:hypothetical protein